MFLWRVKLEFGAAKEQHVSRKLFIKALGVLVMNCFGGWILRDLFTTKPLSLEFLCDLH